MYDNLFLGYRRIISAERSKRCVIITVVPGYDRNSVHTACSALRGRRWESFRRMSGASTDIQADSAKTSVITSVSPRICADTVALGSAEPALGEAADIVRRRNGYRVNAVFSL